MLQNLSNIKEKAVKTIKEAADLESLQEIKVALLGKKGEISQLSRSLGSLSAEERPQMGQAINQAKNSLEHVINEKMAELQKAALAARLNEEAVDISLPGREFLCGGKHPLSLVREEIEEIFLGLGYKIAEGPQVESDYYNFEAMNLPPEHPARDMQDSFYFNEKLLLRTHTSPVQARVMEKQAPELPVKIISPGVVYRRDDDATHSPMFHQAEGLYIDKKVTMADLKGTLLIMVKKLFGADRELRFRPSYFPFTEPSAEVDISCFACGGAGCRLCHGTGWIEILGSGMVHPHVLEMSGYDPELCSGFAFGVGLERIAMLKYGINDMRLLFDNDIRFLNRF
ncbi:MAG: phenylalanine--tRNA ligase subunit alpha [Clostridia bacterium]|nr:phenylalanine--tRNA ligase subunit alpha [Clostridia bacterium]